MGRSVLTFGGRDLRVRSGRSGTLIGPVRSSCTLPKIVFFYRVNRGTKKPAKTVPVLFMRLISEKSDTVKYHKSMSDRHLQDSTQFPPSQGLQEVGQVGKDVWGGTHVTLGHKHKRTLDYTVLPKQ